MLRYINDNGDILTEEELAEAHLFYLNDAYDEVEIAGLHYLVGDILRAVDPIAFRQDFLDYLDAYGWEELDE